MAVNPVFFTCEVCGAGHASPFGFKGVDYKSDPIHQQHRENRQKQGWTGPQFVYNSSVEALLCGKHSQLARQHELANLRKDEALRFLRKLEGLPLDKVNTSNRAHRSQNGTQKSTIQAWFEKLRQLLGFG